MEEQRKKTKILLVAGILITILILISFLWGWSKLQKEEKPEENKTYQFTYFDNYEPGDKYVVQVVGTKVTVTTTNFCSAKDCKAKESVKEYEYSKENAKKLVDFIQELQTSNENLDNLNNSLVTEEQEDVILGIAYGEKSFEIAAEKYEYKLEYFKSNTISYITYFKEDGTILVKKVTENGNFDITNIETYELNFKEENKKLLKEYVKKSLEENSKLVSKASPLPKDEQPFLRSIVENNETYLEDIGKVSLAYTISFHGMNCPTPVLRLYTDNTYELFDTFTTFDVELVPKTGEYHYDMTKLIANISKYASDPMGPYTISDNDNHTYTTYSSNVELNELLGSIGVSLARCTTEA